MSSFARSVDGLIRKGFLRDTSANIQSRINSDMNWKEIHLGADRREVRLPARIFKLHYELAETVLGEKLLQLVLLVWTFDDIASGAAKADQYKQHAELTSGKDEIGCLTIAGQDVDFGLREACNETSMPRRSARSTMMPSNFLAMTRLASVGSVMDRWN